MDSEIIFAMLRKELDARKVWDERPVLQALYLHGGEITGPGVTHPEPRIRVGGEIIEPMMWSEARPPEILEFAAEMLSTELKSDLAETAPKNFYGVLFRHEGWMLVMNENTSEDQREEAMQKAKDHVIYRDPRRVEVRSAIAATADGLYGLTVPRDTTIEPFTTTPETEGSGTVPEALVKIFRALAGLPA